MLLQHSNILETTYCTVIYLLLTVLRNKTPFTAPKTLIIRDLKKLHNPGDGQVLVIGTILFLQIRDLVYLEATNQQQIMTFVPSKNVLSFKSQFLTISTARMSWERLEQQIRHRRNKVATNQQQTMVQFSQWRSLVAVLA